MTRILMLSTMRALQQLCLPLLLGAVTTLYGCASSPTTVVTELKPLPSTSIKDSQRFGQETLYALMAAEIGLVRGRYELGLGNYIQQARETHDIHIAARAAQVARILKRNKEALEMAELWHELDPGSHEARYILVAEYISAERFQEAFKQADRLLSAGYSAGFDDIAIDAAQKNYEGIDKLAERYVERLPNYPKNTELLLGSSVLYQALEQLDEALLYAEQAEALDSDNVRIIYQRFRALSALGREDEATKAYARLVDLDPENKRVRNAYARMLISSDLDAALDQYQTLHSQSPNESDILLNLALIELELGKNESAKPHFERLIKQQEHLSISHFGLGEIAFSQEDWPTALGHYTLVTEGERYVQASSKAATIIESASGFDDARQFLASRRENAGEDQQKSLYIIEASALAKNAGRSAAIELLSQAISAFPESVRLRYARAMQYASLKEPLNAELDFKYILERSPDSAATLNALGYTLLDQTDRTEEAGTFIKRALELEPDDAAILDSMGWYKFKIGKPIKALSYLRQAFDRFEDDEIAAHLGETLWFLGKKSRAKKIWKKGFEKKPDSPIINETLKRLKIDWP